MTATLECLNEVDEFLLARFDTDMAEMETMPSWGRHFDTYHRLIIEPIEDMHDAFPDKELHCCRDYYTWDQLIDDEARMIVADYKDPFDPDYVF